MNLRVAFLTTVAGAALAAPAGAATWPPSASGCGQNGPTMSDARPTAALASTTLRLRYTGAVRVLLRGNQTAAATVSITQAGGRSVGGTASGRYTCTTPGQGIVSLPLNHYGRTLVRRHGVLRVHLTLRLVNGSGVRNTVSLSGVIRPA
jgi:hypothetical protein